MGLHVLHRPLCGIVFWAALLSGCSVYDRAILVGPHQPGGDGGHALIDSSEPAPPDSAAADSGAVDSATPVPTMCAELTTCSPDCPERCNGRDDDCDGDVDEGTSSELCNGAHATTVCDRGACVVVDCAADYRDCDDDATNGCEVSFSDPKNCNSCGNVCHVPNASAACEDSKCVTDSCDPGYGDCDADRLSCETKLVALDHCGGCNMPCGGLADATPQCDSGSCGIKSCLGNYGDCDGNPDNGCEVKLDTLANCGGCNTPCNKASCVGGVCTAAVCTEPMADCNRDEVDCEANVMTDAANCGACGKTCQFQAGAGNANLSCVNGLCAAACTGSHGDCDGDYSNGCEVALDTTVTHCGACATNCNTLLAHVGQTNCSAGTCGIVTCASGWADCDMNVNNGCERNLSVDGPCFPDTNCVKQTSGTHDYYYCTNASTWSAARTRCQTQPRGDLAVISSAGENSVVQALRKADAWIGARDATIEGLWRWERNGEPFWRGTAGGSALLSQYENWSNAQPDDAGGNEDCGEVLSDGTWADTNCSATHAFVCEVMPDECSSDNNKIDPGQCGCGVADTDTDSDGFADCKDACPSDPNKQAAGTCGCGTADTDSDSDGTPNCHDSCPADPTQTGPCLVYAPTNFDPTPVNWSTTPTTMVTCGTTTIDTTDPDGSGSGIATISNWCGTAPVPIAQNQTGGPQVVIIPLRGLSVPSGNTLRIIGPRPVLFAIQGNATIAGTIDANASGTTPGAGGNWSCGSSQGGNGSGDTARFHGASGGGGGGFGTAGGKSGTANTDGGDVNPGAAGATRGSSTLSPLFGGCAGGQAGGCSTVGGAGGGSFQISASGTIVVTGTLRANGAAGATPCGASDEGGGTGGGSGGAIFLEAKTIDTTAATLQVNGGQGGANGSYAGVYNCGGNSGGNGSTSSSSAGDNGGNCQGGSPGGGGGYGRIRTLLH